MESCLLAAEVGPCEISGYVQNVPEPSSLQMVVFMCVKNYSVNVFASEMKLFLQIFKNGIIGVSKNVTTLTFFSC